jgi:hypothetical protein
MEGTNIDWLIKTIYKYSLLKPTNGAQLNSNPHRRTPTLSFPTTLVSVLKTPD